MRPARTPLYRSVPVIIASLVCCAPVGVALMWLFAPWPRPVKGVISGVLGWGLIFGLIGMAVSGAPPRSAPAPTVVAVATVAPTVPPTVPPAAKPTAVPAATATPPPPPTEPPAPTAAAAPPAERVAITGAGTDGVNMRAEPAASAARVKLLKDGHQLEIAGEDRDAGGRKWRNVRDPSDGATGWVAAEFVGGQPATVASQPASKPGSPTSENQAYLNWLQPKMLLIGQSATAIGEQLGEFGRTPAVFLNREWQTKTGFSLGIMKGAAEQMRSEARSVPPAARTLDGNVKTLGADLVAVADEFIAGLSTLDAQRLTRGNQRMTAARANLDRVIAGIEALQKTP